MGELAQTTLQQPTPTPPKHPDASSLEGPEVSPATRLRKRQIGSGSDCDGDGDDNEHQPKRARLTRKNLALFNTMAKKKGNKGSASAPTVESSTTKTTSTTMSSLAVQAHKNGILNPAFSKSPKNRQDIAE